MSKQDKNNDKGRAFGGFVSRDLPIWPYGEPGPERIIAPPHYTAHYVPEPVSINGDAHPGYYHMAMCQQAPDAESTPDDTPAYLAMAGEEVACAIHHLELACADSRVDASVRRKALGALRDALTAIEAEMEARNAEA